MRADERLHGVDWLLIEGTTLGSSGGTHGLRSESDVEEKPVELAGDNRDKLVAVAASGQNLDRLVSCFRAARRAGRQLVIDAYQAYVLMKLAPLSKNIPRSRSGLSSAGHWPSPSFAGCPALHAQRFSFALTDSALRSILPAARRTSVSGWVRSDATLSRACWEPIRASPTAATRQTLPSGSPARRKR